VKLTFFDRLPVKQRQTLVTLGGVGGLFVAVLGGLLLTDSHHRVDLRTPAQKSANDVVRNYRTPGAAADPASVWITNSEAKLKELNASNVDLQHQVNELKGQLLSFEGRARTTATASTPLPGESSSPAQPSSAATTEPSETTPNIDVAGTTHRRGPISPLKTALPLPPLTAMRGASSTPSAMPSGILEVNLSSPPDATLAVSNAGPSSGLASSSASSASGGVISASTGKTAANKEAIGTIRDELVSGTIASAVLLTGFDAPTGNTAKTNPMPVVMRLLTRGTLPNHQSSRIRDCFVTGAGYGDLSAERAYIRLEQLSCVMTDGTVIDNTIEGFVAGEDGKAGLRGKVVSKQGSAIGMAFLTGMTSGMGQSISSSYSTVSTSPLGATSTVNPGEVFQSGAASGVGKALDKIADLYIQRANELFPIVEIDSGRRGDILLTKLAKLGPAFAQAWTQRP
jgi:conjugal transfer pilus assembly protein TraB